MAELWRFQDFSICQILREINFGESCSTKFVNLSLPKSAKIHKNQNSEPLSVNGCFQGRRRQRKSAGAKGGTIFWSGFLLHFCMIWENDPFSKFQKVPGLKPRLPRLVRRPCHCISFNRSLCKLSIHSYTKL